MNTFLQRTLTATVFVIVVLGAILWNVYSYFALFLYITFGCLWEFYALTKMLHPAANEERKEYAPVIVGCCIFILSMLIALGFIVATWYILVLPLLSLIFISELYSGGTRPFLRLGFSILGLVYLAIPFSLLNFMVIHNGVYSWHITLGILLLVWTNDTMAYIIGSLIGRRKLFERISPKKTWEGTIGGILCCLLVGWTLSFYFTDWDLQNWLVISGIVGIVGTLGDLIESLLKRNVGVKDSGAILPGHGGFLDRFDAFVFCIPFIYTYLKIFKTLIM